MSWPSERAMRGALERSVTFLLSKASEGHRWADFETLAGPSDEWVSAYVGYALAETDCVEGRAAAERAWGELRRCRTPGQGWGYHSLVPTDADSTLWALRLGAALNELEGEHVEGALRFLAQHQDRAGAFTTFAKDGPIREFTGLFGDVSFTGWCGVHPCVTAIAAGMPHLPGATAAREWLRASQSVDGSWAAYWWVDPEYTTAFAVEALALDGDAKRAERAAFWACGRAGSPFARAWQVRILLAAPPNPSTSTALGETLSWLLANQARDGSWPASAHLRIPPPHVIDPASWPDWVEDGRGGGSVNDDPRRLFTTATVMAALQRALRQRS